MLVQIKRLLVENDGYKRNISLQNMYINSTNIVSISDYRGAENFLLRENSRLSGERFSLIKLNEGGRTEEIIAFGTAEKLYSDFRNNSGKKLLND